MKLIHSDNLGINFDKVIHVDDWDGTTRGLDKFQLLCHTKVNDYEFFVDNHFKNKVKLCKTCTKKALKTGRCLVTTISAMKLKRI